MIYRIEVKTRRNPNWHLAERVEEDLLDFELKWVQAQTEVVLDIRAVPDVPTIYKCI